MTHKNKNKSSLFGRHNNHQHCHHQNLNPNPTYFSEDASPFCHISYYISYHIYSFIKSTFLGREPGLWVRQQPTRSDGVLTCKKVLVLQIDNIIINVILFIVAVPVIGTVSTIAISPPFFRPLRRHVRSRVQSLLANSLYNVLAKF